MTKPKPNMSLRIEPEIREAFKQETYLKGVDMTEAIESFMVSYVNICRNERRKK